MQTYSPLAVLLACVLSGTSPSTFAEGDAEGVGAAAWFEHCAVCHGRDGTGNGPFASVLRVTPPDLTVLAARNGGVFPAERIRSAVDGRTIPAAHGGSDMPVWGRVLTDAGEPERGVRLRIIDVVAYVRSIQK